MDYQTIVVILRAVPVGAKLLSYLFYFFFSLKFNLKFHL